jgi:iron(III) transport system substrate-binding protein
MTYGHPPVLTEADDDTEVAIVASGAGRTHGARAVRCGALMAAGGLLAASLAGCGAPARSDSTNQLTLYNGQHEQTTQALVDAFEQQTGVTVTIRSDDETVLVQQIAQEGSRSPADVIYTENSPALERLQDSNLLARVGGATLAAIPSRYSSPSGDWVGLSGRVSVLVYNTARLRPDQLPSSVMDLASPAWKGKLGLAPQETDFQPIITSIAQAHGTAAALAWLKGIKANAGSNVYPDNETLTAKVNSGQVQIGLINQYYWYRERAQAGAAATHSALHYFAAGDPGYVLDVSGAGVLASSTHQAAAQKFLAFLASAAGQRIIAQSDSFEYPLRPGIAAHPGLTPLAQLQPDPADSVARLGDGAAALSLLQQAQLG